jgi:6,7-dimethyl-8-ribityllumazine synthase
MSPAAEQPASGPTPRIAVVVSRYNASITDRLLEGALDEHARRAGAGAAPAVYDAPGSFEIPAIALAAAASGRFDGVVALGCIVRGETRHDRYLAAAVTDGLMSIGVRTGVPVAFGVLTVEKAAQARERAGGKKGNKGAEAMGAAIDAALEIARIRSGAAPSGRATARPDKASPGGGG